MKRTLPPPVSLQAEIETHREILREFIGSAETLDSAAWQAPGSVDHWSPAQIAEHLRLSYTTILADLSGQAGFRIRTKWWQRRVLRVLYLREILRNGIFPPKTPATREIRPGDGPFDREQLLSELLRAGEQFVETVASASSDRRAITHPFFGKLSLLDGVRLMTQHIRHHQAQMGVR